jgi:F-type H+-transporting ATPase subunit delta
VDPREAKLANVYATALLDVAFQKGIHAQVRQELEAVCKVIPEVPAIGVAFQLGDQKQIARILKTFEKHLSEVTLNFLQVTARRRRGGLLPQILEAYIAGQHERQGELVAQVRTAVPLEDVQRRSIAAALKKKFEKDIVLEERVDPRLMGGLVMRVGDQRIDGSLRSRLDAMESRLTAVRLRSKDYYDEDQG